MEVVVYLIILVIGLAMSASKKNKQANQKNAKQPVSAPVRSAMPAVKPAKKRPLTQEEIKKAVELLMNERQPKPAPRPRPAETAPAHDDGFYQGTSFGDEGIDPCHDDMYGARHAAEEPAEAVPGFHLQFTKDSVLNGVIMSEILKRKF